MKVLFTILEAILIFCWIGFAVEIAFQVHILLRSKKNKNHDYKKNKHKQAGSPTSF
jgi:hypothetical protein